MMFLVVRGLKIEDRDKTHIYSENDVYFEIEKDLEKQRWKVSLIIRVLQYHLNRILQSTIT